MNITIVLGTGREGRMSEHVARVTKEAFAADVRCRVTLVDVRTQVVVPYTIPAWEKSRQYAPWRTLARESDAFIFVLPEYNHGYPGEWKLLMDAAYKEYAGKRAYVVGVSSGVFAGVRVADHVRPVLVEFGMRVEKTALHIGNVNEAFDDEGALQEADTRNRLEAFVQKVVSDVTAS